MQLPIQVVFIGIPPSEAIDANIRKYAEKLERICSDIISCRVSVEPEGKHQQKGRAYRIRIDLTVPNDEIVVSSNQMNPDVEDAYVAIHHAFDAAARQLSEYVQRRRRDVKTHAPPS